MPASVNKKMPASAKFCVVVIPLRTFYHVWFYQKKYIQLGSTIYVY